MIYDIKAIPTTYAGVNFRSRLEARWAAFFDLCGWDWDYEPFDLDGWAPDFVIRTRIADVLVEVKPAGSDVSASDPVFAKAFRYWNKHQILLLAASPIPQRDIAGMILDPPEGAGYGWLDMLDIFEVADATEKWRRAGNSAQWIPDGNSRSKKAA